MQKSSRYVTLTWFAAKEGVPRMDLLMVMLTGPGVFWGVGSTVASRV